MNQNESWTSVPLHCASPSGLKKLPWCLRKDPVDHWGPVIQVFWLREVKLLHFGLYNEMFWLKGIHLDRSRNRRTSVLKERQSPEPSLSQRSLNSNRNRDELSSCHPACGCEAPSHIVFSCSPLSRCSRLDMKRGRVRKSSQILFEAWRQWEDDAGNIGYAAAA